MGTPRRFRCAGRAATIGQLAPGTPTASCDNSPFDLAQPTVTSGNGYVVPAAGVVTSWSTNAAAGAGQMLKMKIFRLVSGTTYTVVGHDGPRALTPSTVNTFPTHIPVQAGDVLGLNDANASPSVPNACTFSVSGESHREAPGDAADGTSTDFTINATNRVNVTAVVQFPPGITLTTPTSGSISGGTSVTITGHDFTGATAVSFGSTPATSYFVDSDGQITATSPSSAVPGAVDIRVTTAAGTTPVVAGDKFTYTGSVTTSHCVVPKLKGKKLKADRKKLKAADCKLGKVKGPKGKKAKVKKQSPKPGTILPAGSKVNVRTKT